MPRSPHIHFPGFLYHTMARGNAGLLDEKERIEKPRQRSLSLERLATVSASSLPLKLLCSASQARKITAARGELILRALEQDDRPASIAAFLRCSPSAVSKNVSRSLTALPPALSGLDSVSDG